MATMTETIATSAVMTCTGCAPDPRRPSRGRSHLWPLCRRILLITTTIMMMIVMSSHWRFAYGEAVEGEVLLVVVPRGRPTLLLLCSHPARIDGAAPASTL